MSYLFYIFADSYKFYCCMKKILLVLAFFPAIWFASCREESELSVINTHVTLSVGKTEKISFSGTIKSIESTDRFVASVDGYSVTGEHVGTASINKFGRIHYPGKNKRLV